jgi:uncharacterized repeat protein (TIGR02543 family)
MAINRYIRTNNIPVIIFAESKAGYFTHVIDSNDSKNYYCSSNTMRVAACGTSPKTIAKNWVGLTNATATTNNFITCTGSYGSAMYPDSFPNTALSGSITIKDEHGSHYGTQNCINEKCYYSSSFSGCVGVKHIESDSGWIFKGWKVSCVYNTGINIPSANYNRVFLNGQYEWSVLNPTDDDLNNALIIYGITTSGAITVEAIYEELPKYTVSFNLNGGTGDTPAVETYQGDSITIPDYRPTKDGYKFLGWSTSQDATTSEYVSGDEFTPDEDVVLYAVWEESDEPDEPVTPGGGGSAKGFIRRSSTSDYLIFSITTGNLVYN